MISLIAVFLFLIFIFLAGIHLYWGVGGRWGNEAAIPKRDDGKRLLNPGFAACFTVAIGLLCIGLFIIVQAGLVTISLPEWLTAYGLYAIASLFILRAIGEFKYVGIFKTIRHTTFGEMDTRYYSPLCLLIGIFTLLIEWNR